jgi:hypothetical protein
MIFTSTNAIVLPPGKTNYYHKIRKGMGSGEICVGRGVFAGSQHDKALSFQQKEIEMKQKEIEMKRMAFTGFASVCLALMIAVFAPMAKAQDNSPSNPAAIGVPVKSTLELGSTYDVVITVLETVRGKEALQRLKTASPSNKDPKTGYEYLLARIRFELKPRSVSDKRNFDLGRMMQWVAYSSDLKEYESVSVVAPKPELAGEAKANNAVEGWVAFAVGQKETKPIMTFDPASGGAMLRGKVLFFKLF